MSIHEIRQSFIWFERWGSFGSPDSKVVLDFLKSEEPYAKRFDEMMANAVPPAVDGQQPASINQAGTELTPPWPRTVPQYPHWFWTFYVEDTPSNLAGKTAFRKLVPFRTGFPARIRSTKPWITHITDGFLYPHGIGLIMTLKSYFERGDWPKNGISIEKATQSAIQTSTEEPYEVTWEDGTKSSGKLAPLANVLLDHMRARVLGPKGPAGKRTLRPFSVASVIRGDIDGTSPVEGKDVHAAMQGLCTRHNNWQKDTLTPFKDSLLLVRKSGPKDHVLYHTAQARVIWYPNSFAGTDRFNRTIGCYHRNLSLLHLQTEALIQALSVREDLIKKGETVPEPLKGIAMSAAEHLRLLYASGTDTYRSSSPRAYIDENPAVKTLIDGALKTFGSQSLQYKVALT